MWLWQVPSHVVGQEPGHVAQLYRRFALPLSTLAAQADSRRRHMSIDYEAALPHLRVKFAEMGLSFADGTLAQAAAMGITQLVWRNGPIENAHAGERGRRNGLHDGVMFARNTWVFHQALEAVRSTDQYSLLSFEDRILDRSLVWPGTRSTLSRFGY